MRIATPPQVPMVDQPYLSYKKDPIAPSNMINHNPQEIIPSYVPPEVPQPREQINVVSQDPSSSQVIILTYDNSENPNHT